MRKIVAQLPLALALAALTTACSDEATAPHKDMSASAQDFTNSSSSKGASANSVLCSNASGSVFVREQCHKNEQQLDLVALGLVGPPGPPGPPGISGYQIVGHQVSLPAGTSTNVHVECPSGKKVLGGGFNIETPTDVRLFSSEPSDGSGNLIDHGWNVFAQNAGTVARQTSVFAICALVQ